MAQHVETHLGHANHNLPKHLLGQKRFFLYLCQSRANYGLTFCRELCNKQLLNASIPIIACGKTHFWLFFK